MTDREKLLALAKATKTALGMHGPCRNNSCPDCKHAWDLATTALAESTEPMIRGRNGVDKFLGIPREAKHD